MQNLLLRKKVEYTLLLILVLNVTICSIFSFSNEIVEIMLSVSFLLLSYFIIFITKKGWAWVGGVSDFIENINDAIIIFAITEDNQIGKHVAVNQKTCLLLGYFGHELSHMTPAGYISDDGKKQITKLLNTANEDKNIITEIECITKSGKIIPIEASIRLGQ
jgi:PAS domain S-box-containing protein